MKLRYYNYKRKAKKKKNYIDMQEDGLKKKMDKDLPCYALDIIQFCYSKKSSLSEVFDRTKLHKKAS